MPRKTTFTPLPTERPWPRADGWILLVAAILCVLAFGNSLTGAFVYDDTRQIVQNPFIQEAQYVGQALVSDVWAFKGEADQAWSNYWRPVFVGWLMLNYRLWGLSNTLPWHVGNLLLHIAVTLLAYGWLRQLQVARPVAAAITLIFAAHPVHVESVTWISGSPDLLLAVPLLGALMLVHRASALPPTPPTSAKKGTPTSALPPVNMGLLAVAVVLGALAMLAKEVGILLPGLVFGSVWFYGTPPTAPWQTRLRRALLVAAPFAVVAVAYFAARWAVLGQVARTNYGYTGPLSLLLSAPAIFTFYIRQALFPVWIGPNYPLRATQPEALPLENFWGPLLFTGLVLAAALWAARRGKAQALGLLLFSSLLLPAFNISAFIPEHLVHDRYLYLPLLGLWLVLLPTLVELAQQHLKWGSAQAQRAAVVLAVVLCVPFTVQTWRYNQAWQNELALWEWALQSDPTSAFNWSIYAQQLYDAGRVPEAKQALDKALASLAVGSAPDSLILRAKIALEEGRVNEAIADLRVVITNQPTNVAAYEQLAVAYQQAGQLDAAAEVLLTGRDQNPTAYCGLSVNLAVVYYLGQAKTQAQAELEAVRPRMTQDLDPICRLGLFYLGELYTELGRGAEAQTLYQTYLQVTTSFNDSTSRQFRPLAQQRLTP